MTDPHESSTSAEETLGDRSLGEAEHDVREKNLSGKSEIRPKLEVKGETVDPVQCSEVAEQQVDSENAVNIDVGQANDERSRMESVQAKNIRRAEDLSSEPSVCPTVPATARHSEKPSGSAVEATGSLTRRMSSRRVLPIDAKVVVLLKANTPGGRPSFVKLNPVTPPPVRTVPAEFSRTLQFARKRSRLLSDNSMSSRPHRRRRIIPPVAKKAGSDEGARRRRGRPPKKYSTRDASSSANSERVSPEASKEQKSIKEVSSESNRRDHDPDVEDIDIITATPGRPKRNHKTPKRFDDFYSGPVTTKLDSEETTVIGGKEDDDFNNTSQKQPREESEPVQKHKIENVLNENEKEDRNENDVVNEAGNESDKCNQDEANLSLAPVKQSSGRMQCKTCHRYFANQNSLNAHRFKVHKLIIRASVKCPGCDHLATTIHTLNEHVATDHGVKLQYIEKKFKTTLEFQKYLDDLAVTQNMAFVRHRKSDNKRQLYCNRSGAKRIQKEETGLRNRPRKGTAKIGAMCPAHMFYTECDDGSIEVRGQLSHFGHTLDPRYVFPATSTEKATSRLKRSSQKPRALSSYYGRMAVDLDEPKAKSVENREQPQRDESNGSNEMTEVDEEEEEMRRAEEEERLDEELGPVHPKAEEIDIRMKNIDRLCSFLFDNVSEQLYRLDDITMDVLLRSLRTTQNAISNLNSMVIQIKEGDPDVIRKYQRKGPKLSNCPLSYSAGPLRSRKDGLLPQKRQKQLYDTEDYDEDTVYYRHVPLRNDTTTTSVLDPIYYLDGDEVDDEYIEY